VLRGLGVLAAGHGHCLDLLFKEGPRAIAPVPAMGTNALMAPESAALDPVEARRRFVLVGDTTAHGRCHGAWRIEKSAENFGRNGVVLVWAEFFLRLLAALYQFLQFFRGNRAFLPGCWLLRQLSGQWSCFCEKGCSFAFNGSEIAYP
jgi:hypothetical protein